MVKLCKVNFLRGTKPVLTDFTLTVAKGERVCLFGPSGCGKTTALRLIAGLEKQESGSITVNGDISYVFQEHRLCPAITVLQNIMMVTKDESKALSTLDALGIADCAHKKPAKMSGGQRQRAAIARALCAKADILLLDEPFSAIDEQNVQKVSAEILRLYGNKTIIMVSHDASHAELMGAKIINM